MKTATIVVALAGAASALVARRAFSPEMGNTLIDYQPWCPVCDTVAMNTKCIQEGASCMSSTFMAAGNAECEAGCSATCQRVAYVANSDYGYTCNVTRSSTN